jgi:hypothetical protein
VTQDDAEHEDRAQEDRPPQGSENVDLQAPPAAPAPAKPAPLQVPPHAANGFSTPRCVAQRTRGHLLALLGHRNGEAWTSFEHGVLLMLQYPPSRSEMDPVDGCQIGTKCPTLQAKQDQAYPTVLSASGPARAEGSGTKCPALHAK